MFKRSIQSQESYVRQEMAKIKTSDNYVGYNTNKSYSRDQIEGKLRQEYCGTAKYKSNSYVLDRDWDRMRSKKY